MKSNKTHILVLCLGVFFVTIGCNRNGGFDNTVALEKVAETYKAKTVGQEFQTQTTANDLLKNLKIIKNANCRFKVNNVDSATMAAQQIVSKFQGYVSDMRFNNDQYRLENRFTVRLPQEHFDKAMQALSELAVFTDFKNVTTTDVSEEYVDLEARLKTKEEVKERYTDILRTKAKTVEEILLAEEKLRILQEEIEVAQGRLKYLGNKVALSTIQIDLYETVEHQEAPEVYKKTFGAKVKESLSFGWKLIQGIFLGLLYIWPFLVLTLGVVFYIRRRKRK